MAFINDNFLLHSDLSKKLYNDFCKDLPIYDYHCHLSAEEIYRDEKFSDLYEIWLKGDHYKWRLMRLSGIPEEEITGNAEPYGKYLKYVASLEKAIGNPLYHWSHLELARCFKIDDIIKTENAEIIWKKANDYIENNRYSPRKAIKEFNVDTVVTTEEVFSDLKYHKLLKEDKNFKTQVLPSFRGDKLVNLNFDAIRKLSEVTDIKIKHLDDLLSAISKQIEFFDLNGARSADMGLEGFVFRDADYEDVEETFLKARDNIDLTSEEREAFGTFMMLYLLREFYGRGWAVMLHIGARRNNNTFEFIRKGADRGFDSVSDKKYSEGLNILLDVLKYHGDLGKTVIFNLNPADNYLVGTAIGNFSDDKARMQFGMAWWFNDHKEGIINMMKDLGSLSNFSDFLGMLTDSRSFISYVRHEYFRRILCDFVAGKVLSGEYPEEIRLIEETVKGISYYNAKKYFN